jgi:hypothetical protein
MTKRISYAAGVAVMCLLVGCGSGTRGATANAHLPRPTTTAQAPPTGPTKSSSQTTASGPIAAAVTATTSAPAKCFTVTTDAKYPGYAVANFGQSDVSSLCGHQITNATFIVRKVGGAWRVSNRGGTIACPVRGVPDRIAKALGIPC